MSDIFDHALDAAESEMEYWYGSGDSDGGGSTFVRNPLYYFTRIIYNEIKKETDKAILLRLSNHNFWIPKALLKEHDRENNEVWMQTKFLKNLLEKVND